MNSKTKGIASLKELHSFSTLQFGLSCTKKEIERLKNISPESQDNDLIGHISRTLEYSFSEFVEPCMNCIEWEFTHRNELIEKQVIEIEKLRELCSRLTDELNMYQQRFSHLNSHEKMVAAEA